MIIRQADNKKLSPEAMFTSNERKIASKLFACTQWAPISTCNVWDRWSKYIFLSYNSRIKEPKY